LDGTEPGLIGVWSFNEGSGNQAFNSKTSSTNHGTFSASMNAFSHVEGYQGIGAPLSPQATLTFNGTNQFIEIPHSAALNLPASATIEAWIKPTGTGLRTILFKGAEGYGLAHWGKPRGEISYIKIIPLPQAFVYEFVQIILLVGIVFVVAWLIKSLGETFHGRHTFRQAFTVAAYGLSPVFLMRIFDIFPSVSPWLTWVRFMIWLFVGLVIYFLYGAKQSDLCRESKSGTSDRSRQLTQARLWIGIVLLAFSALLCFSGLSRHGELSDKIGSALAIPFKDARLHTSIVFTGFVMLLLGLVFFWRARKV
jgi:hypothetical protein